MKEIDVTGSEGLLGVSRLTGDLALGTAKVQSAGYALQLETSMLEEATARGTNLCYLLMRYIHALLNKLTLYTVYEHQYRIDQQLSRWLLGRLDRQPTNELAVTHELIGNMLGVRRESVTEAASRLRDEGLIRSKRGRIVVIDRIGLERKAGKGYEIARQEFERALSAVALVDTDQEFCIA